LQFAIKQVQTDNGSEFSEQFSWHLDDLGISHRVIAKQKSVHRKKMVKSSEAIKPIRLSSTELFEVNGPSGGLKLAGHDPTFGLL